MRATGIVAEVIRVVISLVSGFLSNVVLREAIVDLTVTVVEVVEAEVVVFAVAAVVGSVSAGLDVTGSDAAVVAVAAAVAVAPVVAVSSVGVEFATVVEGDERVGFTPILNENTQVSSFLPPSLNAWITTWMMVPPGIN